jgi:hypothetical protein
MAIGALEELQARGLRVPDDVAVAGFDDWGVTVKLIHRMTTVRQPTYALGRSAVETVLKQIETGEVSEQIVLPTELVVRQSCGCKSASASLAATGSVDPSRQKFENIISVLRRQLLPALVNDAARLAQADDLWQQGRVAISEGILRVQAYQEVQIEQQSRLLRDIDRALITTFDVAGLMDILAVELPRLGISSSYLALYWPITKAGRLRWKRASGVSRRWNWCRKICGRRIDRIATWRSRSTSRKIRSASRCWKPARSMATSMKSCAGVSAARCKARAWYSVCRNAPCSCKPPPMSRARRAVCWIQPA